MILYHVSTESLIEGQILEPGKFWKGMKEEFNPNNLVIKIELIFESIREKIYPFQVSRSNCVFACKEIENARLFLNLYRKNYPQSSIYEIEIDNKTNIFDGDFTIITTPGQTITQIEQSAKDYWSGKRKTNFIETLIGGLVKVVKKVE